MKKDQQEANDAQQKQTTSTEAVNLNDYAGDAEDDNAARSQSGKYVEDLDRDPGNETGGGDERSA